MSLRKSLVHSLVVGAVVAISASAHANLIPTGPVDETGTGLGAVNTILTIHDNDGTEAGSVGLDGAGNQVTTGDTTAITQVRSFGELALAHASDIQIIFNTAEPGNDALNSVRLDSLTMSIFSAGGSLLFSASTAGPLTFQGSDLGIGKAGFGFVLDAPQAAAAEAAAFGANFSPTNVIGLAASVSLAEGGPETFFAVQVPEPETYAMMLAGLGLLGLMARRRREVKEG